jgi:hypothetical protein
MNSRNRGMKMKVLMRKPSKIAPTNERTKYERYCLSFEMAINIE